MATWSNLGGPAPGQNYSRQAGNIIQQGQAQGLFDPMGSSRINAAVRANALRNSDNMRRRQALLSRLMGLDPNQARVQAVQADRDASFQTSGALNDARLQQLLGGQQFARGLFGGQLQNEQSLANQKELMKYQQRLNRPTLGGIAGGLVGQAGGAFLGNYFGGLGSRMGGGGRRQQQMQEAYDLPQQDNYFNPYDGPSYFPYYG